MKDASKLQTGRRQTENLIKHTLLYIHSHHDRRKTTQCSTELWLQLGLQCVNCVHFFYLRSQRRSSKPTHHTVSSSLSVSRHKVN